MFTSTSACFKWGNKACPYVQIKGISGQKKGETFFSMSELEHDEISASVATILAHCTRLASVARDRNSSFQPLHFFV